MPNPKLKYNHIVVDFYTVNEDSYKQLQETQKLYEEGKGLPLFVTLNLINMVGMKTTIHNLLTLPPYESLLKFAHSTSKDVPKEYADRDFLKEWAVS